jgi:hypothetical protein
MHLLQPVSTYSGTFLRRSLTLKLVRTTFLLTLLAVSAASFMTAQSVDAYAGVGTNVAASNGQAIDTFGTGNLYSTPRMSGLFTVIGGTFMFTPHFGVGGETSFRNSQGDYAGLKYRPLFYDFNGVWKPLANSHRFVPEFQAGLGAVNTKFYYSQQSCDAFAGCSTSNSFLESSNHFQAHFAAGLDIYIKNGFFFRPQVDGRWVNNFFQFGSDWVPQYTAAIGYTFGRSR